MSTTLNELKYPYAAEIPELLSVIAAAPSVQRLRQVGMNCGCEYTAFPMFRHPDIYHRYEHSLGVSLIIWHFTGDIEQSAAGLLHDIATPVFAHVIDFVKGDYLKQEATEAGTRECIEADIALVDSLRRYGLTVDGVCDYHRYPVADNDSPRLSADRLEYTLGNILQFGFGDRNTISVIYNDLAVGTAEDGAPELSFQHPETALCFAKLALRCSRLYVSPEDRYAMQRLAEVIRLALGRGTLTYDSLYGTEQQVISCLRDDPVSAAAWNDFTALKAVRLTDAPEGCVNPRRIPAKKRRIDPLVNSLGCRVSALYPDFGKELEAYVSEPQTQWISEAV